MTYNFVVEKNIRLDEILRNKLPELLKKEISNSKIRRLIISGNVYVNGRKNSVPGYELYSGTKVSVDVDEDKLFYEKAPDDISYELTAKDVLFEDESIIVVNKPSHFPSEPGMVEGRDNLHAAVVRFLFERQKIQAPNAKNPPYVGIMHRLDRDTSGVILFTKTRTVNAACHDMFEKHLTKKEYLAVVSQKPSMRNFTVEFPMGRISPKSQAAKWGKLPESKGGQNSKTEFCVADENQPKTKFFFVKARLFTGRTHQIRVHLSSIGSPILGDVLYGGKPYERIMLHAKKLTFPHPVTGREMAVEAPLPKEFLK